MTLDNNTRPGWWRIQSLSHPPMVFEPGEPVPARGWAILAETWVYKDGVEVGLHPTLRVAEGGRCSLSFEVVGNATDRELLA
jgi:hypothetical protein